MEIPKVYRQLSIQELREMEDFANEKEEYWWEKHQESRDDRDNANQEYWDNTARECERLIKRIEEGETLYVADDFEFDRHEEERKHG